MANLDDKKRSSRGVAEPLRLKKWLLPAFAFAMLTIAGGSVQHWIHYSDAARNSEIHAKIASNLIAVKCQAPATRPECVANIEQSKRANVREEFDLYAQTSVALWTAIMGAMATVGIALSGIGVYLIWRTWDATREAANSARLTLDAYLRVERATIVVGIVDMFRSSTVHSIDLSLNNIGKSHCVVTAIGYHFSNNHEWNLNGATVGERDLIVKEGAIEIMPNGIRQEGEFRPFVHGWVRYRTAHGSHKSFFSFQFWQKKGSAWMRMNPVGMPDDT